MGTQLIALREVVVVVHLYAVKYILQKLYIVPFSEHKYTNLI